MPTKPPVLTKKENYRLFQAMAFGNKLRDWRTVKEWENDGSPAPVSLRTLLGGGGPCYYNLSGSQLLVWWYWHERRYFLGMAEGVHPSDMVIGEMAPDTAIAIQGEYYNGVFEHNGEIHAGEFLYSTVQKPMREALRTLSDTVHGLTARHALQSRMTASSWADFEALLEQYPDHVLEVSVFDRCLGNIPGRNAIVWEVRRY